jgi:hypothetical protein
MVREPQYPERCILPAVKSRLLRVSDAVLEAAEEACASVDKDVLDFCVEDVLRTGDVAIAQGYGMAF